MRGTDFAQEWQGRRSLMGERAFAGYMRYGGDEDLCIEWEADEIETGMNPYRPPSRPPEGEWCDLSDYVADDEVAAWMGHWLRPRPIAPKRRMTYAEALAHGRALREARDEDGRSGKKSRARISVEVAAMSDADRHAERRRQAMRVVPAPTAEQLQAELQRHLAAQWKEIADERERRLHGSWEDGI